MVREGGIGEREEWEGREGRGGGKESQGEQMDKK